MRLLNDSGYMYIFINQMMVGEKFLAKIIKSIVLSGFLIQEMIPAFSNYPLPKNFREYTDLVDSMKKINCTHIEELTSSASTLIVIKSEKSSHDFIKKDYSNENIYERYL